MNEIEYHAPEVKETEKFYKRSLWWIGHREKLKHAGLAAWVVLDVILVLFTVVVLVDAFLVSFEAERGLVRELLVENPTTTYERTRASLAKPLEIGTPMVLAVSDTRYDFVGFVTNPNEEWWAEFVYTMSWGEKETEAAVTMVYPGETRPITALGIETVRPRDPHVRISTVRWHRIDAHAIPDFTFWKNDRFNFQVNDTVFEPVVNGGAGGLSRSSFTLTNRTAFGYWSVPLTVLLKRGSAVIGVNTTSIEQMEAGETARVDLNWFQSFPTVEEVVVVPTLNIFDTSLVMPARGEPAVDTRE